MKGKLRFIAQKTAFKKKYTRDAKAIFKILLDNIFQTFGQKKNRNSLCCLCMQRFDLTGRLLYELKLNNSLKKILNIIRQY